MTRRAILATCVVLLYGTISDYGAWTMFKVLATFCLAGLAFIYWFFAFIQQEQDK